MKKIAFLLLFLAFSVILKSQQIDSIIDIRDNQVYPIVKIGQQWWMQENLDIGTMIIGSQDAADNDTIEKYCQNNSDSLCNIYGGLYQWNEMMDYSPSDDGNPATTRGLCPIGWHIPSLSEWTEMTDSLGGATVAGGKLKEAGLNHWWNPNAGATNESGFTALPAGSRNENGSFHVLGDNGIFWSSTEGSSGYAWYMILDHMFPTVSPTNFTKILGLSVRCISNTDPSSYLVFSDKDFNMVSSLSLYGYSGSEEIILINSSARESINISSIYTGNPAFNMNYSSALLTPGDSIHLAITFNPPDAQIYRDTLTIVCDDPYDSIIRIPLFGTFPMEVSINDSTNISCYGYADGSATVGASLGTPPYQYQWDDPANTTAATAAGLAASLYYHVTLTDSKGWMVSDSVMLAEPDSLIIQSEYPDFICLGSNNGFIAVNPSGGTPPYQYAWLHGGDSQNLVELPAGNYSVSVTDSSGCQNSQDYLINSIVPYEDENICIVTIDSLTGRNLVVWEKTPGVGIASYNIYREGNLLETLDYNELSVYLDAEADPRKRPYLYRISILDTCGNESGLSPYHKPLFLQYVGSVDGVNLTWSKYEVEGQVLYFDSYTVYRGSDSSALSPLEANIPKEIDVFTDNDPDALTRKFFYRVAGVLPDPCTPTETIGKKADSGPYSHALSNVEDNRLHVVEGLPESHVKSLSVLPNPFTERTSLIFDNRDGSPYTLFIIDLSGKVCRVVDRITASYFILERDGLKEGFYLLELRGSEVLRGKMIVE